jgi:hypothetical protein
MAHSERYECRHLRSYPVTFVDVWPRNFGAGRSGSSGYLEPFSVAIQKLLYPGGRRI